MAFNVLSLWLYKETLLRVTSTTSYNNCYFLIAKLPNVFFLVKDMTNDFIFDEKLGCTGIQNYTTISAFLNFFYIKAIYFLNGITLS